MKNFFIILIIGILSISLAGCARFSSLTGKHPALPEAVPYQGPKARIVIADLEVKAAKANSRIGDGLYSMLTAEFAKTNRFLIVTQRTQAPDLIIAVSLVDFQPQASGGKGGIGSGGGAGSGAFGGLLGSSLNKAYLVLDIRLINAATSEAICEPRYIKGEASDFSEIGKPAPLANGLSVYANTPMEKAIRASIMEGVRFITQGVPRGYYKY